MKNKPTIKTPIPAASPFPNFTFARIPSLRGCSCLHLSLSRLIAHAPQINTQSSIVNNKYAQSLSRPSCRRAVCFLAYSSPMHFFSVFSVNSVAVTQLCKTNPILATTKPPQHLSPQRLTLIFHLTGIKKTNPNKPNPATPGKHRESSIQHQVSSPVYAKQTQFPKGQNQRNLLCHTDLPQYSTPPNPKKQSQNKPNFAPPRNTTSDIHHPAQSTVEQSLFTIYTFSLPLVWLSAQSAPNCPQAALMPRPIRKRIVVSIPDSSRISAKRPIFSVLLPVNSHPR